MVDERATGEEARSDRWALRSFRYVALAEGISFLVLLFVAMPLKYGLGMPTAVRLVGMLHGVLFVLYLVALGNVAAGGLLRGRRVLEALAASVIPFGVFAFDRVLRRDEAERSTGVGRLVGPG